ncbi:glycosyltransferase family 39 protein [Nocardioidaceae bacterium]|nr:glycosyltransferase family 39 protein [Nocardioidaceae bacterium]
MASRRGGGLVAALGAYAAVKVAALAAVAVAIALRDPDGVPASRGLIATLLAWDGQWYAGIARDGYGDVVVAADGRVLSDYAFFPLLPALERVLGDLLGLPYARAGLLLAVLCAPVAAAGIFVLTRRVLSPRAATVAVLLWACLPSASVQTMAYTESLFTAVLVWSVWFVLRGRLLPAATLAAAAVLTRPTGVAVALAVGLVAVLAVAGRTTSPWPEARRPGRPEALLAGLLLVVATLAHPAYVAGQVGQPLGYLEVTEGWQNSFDGGLAYVGFLGERFAAGPAGVAVAVVLLAATLAVLVLTARLARPPYPWPLLVVTAVIVVLAFTTSGYFGSKPRYLIPAVGLLLPPAAWLATRPGRTRWAVLGAVAAAHVAYTAVWMTGTGPP